VKSTPNVFVFPVPKKKKLPEKKPRGGGRKLIFSEKHRKGNATRQPQHPPPPKETGKFKKTLAPSPPQSKGRGGKGQKTLGKIKNEKPNIQTAKRKKKKKPHEITTWVSAIWKKRKVPL